MTEIKQKAMDMLEEIIKENNSVHNEFARQLDPKWEPSSESYTVPENRSGLDKETEYMAVTMTLQTRTSTEVLCMYVANLFDNQDEVRELCKKHKVMSVA